MDGFSLAAVLGIAAFMFACGGAVGFLVSHARQNASSGGKTADELRQELEAYQEKVGAHFEKSSELFQGLTSQYRELYQHMAENAGELVDEKYQGAALGFSGAALLSDALEADAREVSDEAADGEAAEPLGDSAEDADLAAATFTLDPDEAEADETAAEDTAAVADSGASEDLGDFVDLGGNDEIDSEDTTVRA